MCLLVCVRVYLCVCWIEFDSVCGWMHVHHWPYFIFVFGLGVGKTLPAGLPRVFGLGWIGLFTTAKPGVQGIGCRVYGLVKAAFHSWK
jgi:hypothetical protein